MLPVFFLLILPLWCRFSLLKGFSKASQRLSITAASPLFARKKDGRKTGESREKGGREADNFLKNEI